MVLESLAISNKTRKVRSVVPESQQESLVHAAKSGQSTGFAEVFERYRPQLLRVAHRITRNREDSEDAVQDALLSAFVHLSDFDGRSSFATWLTRIAINSALMILRKRRTSLEIVAVGSDDFSAVLGYEIADRAPNPERRYAKSEEERILKDAVQRLRPTLRHVVEVQQLQERSIRETAEVMCVSVAATKARLFNAKVALRKSPILKLMQKTGSLREFPASSAA